MRWKRDAHNQHGTTLLQTTSAMLRDWIAFVYLTRELATRGVVLDPDPDRDAPGEQLLLFDQLLTLVRTFLAHVKSNRLTEPQLLERVAAIILNQRQSALAAG